MKVVKKGGGGGKNIGKEYWNFVNILMYGIWKEKKRMRILN